MRVRSPCGCPGSLPSNASASFSQDGGRPSLSRLYLSALPSAVAVVPTAAQAVSYGRRHVPSAVASHRPPIGT
eukprot:1195895-Prorocentrum_minimum.AAC.5